MEATPTTDASATTPPVEKKKRTKVPPPEPADNASDHAFELTLSGPGSLRKLQPIKWTKDDENRDVIDVRLAVEITGDECFDGVPYSDAAQALLKTSQTVTEGIDQVSLKVKKSYSSVLVLLNDPLFKARVTVQNCLVSTTPEIAVVKGKPRVRVGFSGQVFAGDLLPLSRMLGRQIAVVTEPAQQSLL